MQEIVKVFVPVVLSLLWREGLLLNFRFMVANKSSLLSVEPMVRHIHSDAITLGQVTALSLRLVILMADRLVEVVEGDVDYLFVVRQRSSRERRKAKRSRCLVRLTVFGPLY